MTDPIRQEQQHLAEHICARLNAGVSFETLLMAFNTMTLDTPPADKGEAAEVLH